MSSSNYLLVKNWKRERKLECITYKGGKCERCGYCNLNYPSAFHFHHTDPTTKDFTIAVVNKGLESKKAELDKCILLCATCHAEAHEDMQRDLINEAIEAGERVRNKLRVEKTVDPNKLPNGRRVLRPSREEIEQLVAENGYTKTGRMFGVSDNAIRKWLK